VDPPQTPSRRIANRREKVASFFGRPFAALLNRISRPFLLHSDDCDYALLTRFMKVGEPGRPGSSAPGFLRALSLPFSHVYFFSFFPFRVLSLRLPCRLRSLLFLKRCLLAWGLLQTIQAPYRDAPSPFSSPYSPD